MFRLCLLSTAALAGCSFEGSHGLRLEPDAEVAPDAALDANPPDSPLAITCPGFVQVGTSAYRVIDQQVAQPAAVDACKAYPHAHLATFETITEPADVVTGLALTVPVWSGTVQAAGALLPGTNWVNKIDEQTTPIPLGFPWRLTTNEPNDNNLTEDGEEDFAQLFPPGVFDDTPLNRSARILCECTPTAVISGT